MHVIYASDFRKGSKILFNDEPYVVTDFTRVKPGKGGAYMRTKLKNLITQLVREETFRVDEKFDDPNLTYKDMQYLYDDGEFYHFLDQNSFDEVLLKKGQIEEVLDYLKEQEIYSVLYFGDKSIGVTPPLFMALEVKETQPGVRGDTAHLLITFSKIYLSKGRGQDAFYLGSLLTTHLDSYPSACR